MTPSNNQINCAGLRLYYQDHVKSVKRNTRTYLKNIFDVLHVATVSARLSDQLNQEIETMVEEGVFKDKTDAFHEAVRLLLKEYNREIVTG